MRSKNNDKIVAYHCTELKSIYTQEKDDGKEKKEEENDLIFRCRAVRN
jgi:hypothetical protein